MFRYNNKTYRIDGIAWDHTPSNTFKRGDADTSFKNYYKSVGIVHSTLKKKALKFSLHGQLLAKANIRNAAHGAKII